MSVKINFDNVDLFVLSGMESIMDFKVHEARFENIVCACVSVAMGWDLGPHKAHGWFVGKQSSRHKLARTNDPSNFDKPIRKEGASVF